MFYFLNCVRINGTLGVYFTLELSWVSVYKSFASFCSDFLEAAPKPYVQDTILNLPNPYLRSTSIHCTS